MNSNPHATCKCHIINTLTPLHIMTVNSSRVKLQFKEKIADLICEPEHSLLHCCVVWNRTYITLLSLFNRKKTDLQLGGKLRMRRRKTFKPAWDQLSRSRTCFIFPTLFKFTSWKGNIPPLEKNNQHLGQKTVTFELKIKDVAHLEFWRFLLRIPLLTTPAFGLSGRSKSTDQTNQTDRSTIEVAGSY